jgi:prolyl oligopeptidase
MGFNKRSISTLVLSIPLFWGGCCHAPAGAKERCNNAASSREASGKAPAEKPTPPLAPVADSAKAQEPPQARRLKLVETIFDQVVSDPYRWLEDMSSKETRSWTTAQDDYARQFIAQLPLRDEIAKRLAKLSYVEWVSAPRRKGNRYFFVKQHADREKAIHYWREGKAGKEKILLDPNTLSKDGSIALKSVVISHDGRKAAYKLSKNAADDSILYVMDVASGETSKIDQIEGARYAYAQWVPGAKGFYYTRLPVDPSIPKDQLPGHAAVYYHELGTAAKTDRLIYPKTGNPSIFLSPQLSRDGTLLFVYKHYGWRRTDIYLKDLKRKKGAFRPLAVGKDAAYAAYPHKRTIYLLTNEDAPRYRLFKVKARAIERKRWREIVAEDKDAVLDGLSIVGGHLALSYLRNANSQLVVADLNGKTVRQVKLPGLGSTWGLSGHPDDDEAFYSFSSYITAKSVYQTSVRSGGTKPYFTPKLDIDSSPYTVEQVFYPSPDGTRVSMFIIRRKDLIRDGSTPFMLYGYGGFNISLTPRFRASYFVWLEQGGAIAIPNLRGGGEYGEAWHRAGMLTRKQNVFDDFIAAAQFLIAKKYTTSKRLAIRGGSNGGLLVGAAMTQRPELFRAVACHVPLLDMIRYHRFGAGKTWIEEYGSADDREQFTALLAYSPYHRVKEGSAYPAMLMLSADSDDRVDPMHARKFTAAIQHANTGAHPILLRVETKAGHGGGDMIKKRVARTADEWSFLLHQLKGKIVSSTRAKGGQ